MDEERAVPVVLLPIPLLLASSFFPTIVLLLAPIPIFTLLPNLPMSPMSYHNAGQGGIPELVPSCIKPFPFASAAVI